MPQVNLSLLVGDVDGGARSVLFTNLQSATHPCIPTKVLVHRATAMERGEETYPGDVVVRVYGPDSSGMRVGNRRNKHIALEDVNRRGRDEREESREGRKDTKEEKVRKGVRELHDGCVMRNSLSG